MASPNNNAQEAPLGFAGDVDGSVSFRLSSSASGRQHIAPLPGQQTTTNNNNSSGSTEPVKVELLPPPSLNDGGMVGGGVLLTGVQAGRSVLAWRAQEEGSGLWLEERGLDDDLEGGGLHLKLQGE